MSDKGETKVETVARGNRTFGRKAKDHCKKLWWLHLIIFCVCFLIITLCLVYVGFPNIAQDDVNKAVLSVEAQSVSDPTPDTVTLHIESINDSDSMFHPALDAFNASLSLCTSSSSADAQPPFGQIEIPAGTAGDAVPVTIDQVMTITDIDEFTKYNIEALTAETFYMYVSGDVTLHEGALPATTANYDKVVEMKGLNSLKGFEITDTKIDLAKAKGDNMKGKIMVPNPSVLTIEMGDVYMDLYVDGDQVGYSMMKDVTLKPGDNHFDLVGQTDADAAFKLLKKYPDLQVPIDIKGNRSVVNGKEIPYFSAALQANELHTVLDLSKAI